MNDIVTEEKKVENKIKLISLYCLLQEDQPMVFSIPSYQRGYRWTRKEVKLLLDDIWEFVEKKRNKKTEENEFYCLQPVVVKYNTYKDSYELIDGQQRLTTVKLIMHCIFEELKMPLQTFYRNKHDFVLQYETRDLSQKYIQEIHLPEAEKQKKDNIDFHHIWEAYDEINKWFAEKDYDDINKFRETLLQSKDIDNPVKIILYEVFDEHPYEIFSRLNIGKIKLTNAELIKALFLKNWDEEEGKKVFKLKQDRIATDWNLIENMLQKDELWYFISNDEEKYENRIEFLFDLLSNKQKGDDDYHCFYYFYNNDFQKQSGTQQKPNIDKIWERVKNLYLRISDWYSDREIYHYIGYLIATGESVSKITAYYEEKDSAGNLLVTNKEMFKELLRKKIRNLKINLTPQQFADLSYPDSKIYNSLLLFNILTLAESEESEQRYPFHLHKKQNWDIEHIRSQTDKSLSTNNEWNTWIGDIFEFFTGKICKDLPEAELQNKDWHEEAKINNILTSLLNEYAKDKKNTDLLKSIFKELQEYFREDEVWDGKDGISNLTLLDSYTNRSYGNSFFPIKRNRIIQNEFNGLFTPVGTKNVFMKFYSKKLDDIMFWKKSDSASYFEALETKLKPYLRNDE